MNYSINYIIAIYIGPNRPYPKYQEKFKNDPMFFVKTHVDFLNKCYDSNIQLATFLFNEDMSDELKQIAIQTINQIKTMNVEIVFRPNIGFSYGGWNETIKRNINDYDYFFLIEDDYIPINSKFYEDFVTHCTLEYPFVSTLVNEYAPGKLHAACSNSIVRADVCKIILERYKELFLVVKSNIANDAYHTQMTFLDLFTSLGYGMRDMTYKYSTPFNCNCYTNEIKIYGNKELPPILVPIIP
jgi:hypothetical protein